MIPTSMSLLERLNADPASADWQKMADLYSPLIRGWLKKNGIHPNDADDLVQEVLTVLVRRLPEFRHNTRAGAFRAWLRAICVNCSRDYWKANRIRPNAVGGSDFDAYLNQLADSDNPLAVEWDREHDRYVTRRLLEQIQGEFEARSWDAFRRVALEGEPASQVAEELGLTTNAVFIAKSRVLARLREEAKGLVD